jgi:hypothetical protein
MHKRLRNCLQLKWKFGEDPEGYKKNTLNDTIRANMEVRRSILQVVEEEWLQ